MNKFDDYIKEKAKKEKFTIPDNVNKKLEQALCSLPEENKTKAKNPVKITIFKKMLLTAASLAFVCLVFLPNVSTVYAQTLEKIPLISNIIKVVTIRNYFYSDDHHNMDITVPKIEGQTSEATDYINKSVDDLTKILVDRFNEELNEIGNQGHSSIYVNYDVVTNTEKWFTLKIEVFEAAGSSNTYYKYYHIDKQNNKIVTLNNLTENSKFYSVIEDEIKNQMRNLMAADKDLIYWVDNSTFGQDIIKVEPTHNFYWDSNNNLVIVFDKYEVAPGYMGTPEFTINKKLIKKYLRPEYR